MGLRPVGLGPMGAAMAGMYYLVFWQRRSTATVVNATDAAQARRLAFKQKKQGYGRCCVGTADVVTSGIWVLLSVIAEDFIADFSVVNQLIEHGHILGCVAQ